MIQPDPTSKSELLDRLQQLMEEERLIVQRLAEFEQQSMLDDATRKKIALREDEIKSMRGNVNHYGDIISPIEVKWDADR